MDAFEELIAGLLRADGYWVHLGYKIDLTREEKRALDNHSMPRPEIDLVAYRPATNELLAVECKSYLDSGGVHARDIIGGGRNWHRYKMFVNDALREKVLAKLVEQLRAARMVTGDPNPTMTLIYGHASAADEAQLKPWFEERGWKLWGPEWIRDHLNGLAQRSYDNEVASMVAKLLLDRKPVARPRPLATPETSLALSAKAADLQPERTERSGCHST